MTRVLLYIYAKTFDESKEKRQSEQNNTLAFPFWGKWLDGMKMKVKTIEVGNEKTTTPADFFKIIPLSSFARIARKIHSPHRGKQEYVIDI